MALFPRAIFRASSSRPKDIADCFDSAVEAFNLAEKYECPGYHHLGSAALRTSGNGRARAPKADVPIDRGALIKEVERQ